MCDVSNCNKGKDGKQTSLSASPFWFMSAVDCLKTMIKINFTF